MFSLLSRLIRMSLCKVTYKKGYISRIEFKGQNNADDISINWSISGKSISIHDNIVEVIEKTLEKEINPRDLDSEPKYTYEDESLFYEEMFKITTRINDNYISRQIRYDTYKSIRRRESLDKIRVLKERLDKLKEEKIVVIVALENLTFKDNVRNYLGKDESGMYF